MPSKSSHKSHPEIIVLIVSMAAFAAFVFCGEFAVRQQKAPPKSIADDAAKAPTSTLSSSSPASPASLSNSPAQQYYQDDQSGADKDSSLLGHVTKSHSLKSEHAESQSKTKASSNLASLSIPPSTLPPSSLPSSSQNTVPEALNQKGEAEAETAMLNSLPSAVPGSPESAEGPGPGMLESSENQSFVQPKLIAVVAKSRFAQKAQQNHAVLPAGEDAAHATVMRLYGATFIAKPGLKLPPYAVFEAPAQVRSYQKTLPLKRLKVGRYNVVLQTEALNAFSEAEKEAAQYKLRISPVGDIASLRSYEDTAYIWHKYLEKGLNYWVANHKVKSQEARRILALPPRAQLNAVLALEEKGLYLHANHIHSIMNLAAPPGGSQHISGLAMDIEEHQNPKVREILNRHGFFQTVLHDSPHFIFLGRKTEELADLGLVSVLSNGRQYWIPDIPPVVVAAAPVQLPLKPRSAKSRLASLAARKKSNKAVAPAKPVAASKESEPPQSF